MSSLRGHPLCRDGRVRTSYHVEFKNRQLSRGWRSAKPRHKVCSKNWQAEVGRAQKVASC